MSDPILQSNQSSAVVATVNASTTKNPWVYNETERLTVPHSLQLLPVDNTSGSTTANASCEFAVAKNGFAQGMWLRVDGTLGNHQYVQSGNNAPDTFSAYGFLDLIEEVTLSTSGRIVEKLTKHQIFARYSSLPASRRDLIIQDLHCSRESTAITTFQEQYIWLPFYFYRDPHRYGILTTFEEPHHVSVKWSDLSIVGMNSPFKENGTIQTGVARAQPAISKAQLMVHYRILDEAHLNQVVSKNYGDGMLSRMVGVSKRELPVVDTALATGTATTNFGSSKDAKAFIEAQVIPSKTTRVDIKETDAIRCMYIMVTTDDRSVYQTKNSKNFAIIEHVKLTFNNTVVMDVPASFLNVYGSSWDFMRSGPEAHEGDTTPGAMKRIVRIDLGHGLDHRLDNVVALRELSNPTVEVTYKPLHRDNVSVNKINGSEHTVHVIYETATFLSCSADTGRVQLSIST